MSFSEIPRTYALVSHIKLAFGLLVRSVRSGATIFRGPSTVFLPARRFSTSGTTARSSPVGARTKAAQTVTVLSPGRAMGQSGGEAGADAAGAGARAGGGGGEASDRVRVAGCASFPTRAISRF